MEASRAVLQSCRDAIDADDDAEGTRGVGCCCALFLAGGKADGELAAADGVIRSRTTPKARCRWM